MDYISSTCQHNFSIYRKRHQSAALFYRNFSCLLGSKIAPNSPNGKWGWNTRVLKGFSCFQNYLNIKRLRDINILLRYSCCRSSMMPQWNFYYTSTTVLLQCNHHSVEMQLPFSCDATTVQLQYSGHLVAVENKCYFTIVVKAIPAYQGKVRQNMHFSIKKLEKGGKIGVFQL